MSSSKNFSLWLVSSGSQHAQLSSMVKQIASENGLIPFQAHVTLIPTFQGDPSRILDAFKALLSPPSSLSQSFFLPFLDAVAGPDTNHWKYRCVYALCGNPPPLKELREKALSALSLSPTEPYMPHLSLAYSECAMEVRKAWADKVREEVVGMKGVDITAVELWDTTSPVESEWCMVWSLPLQ
jgi:hypothetical protein